MYTESSNCSMYALCIGAYWSSHPQPVLLKVSNRAEHCEQPGNRWKKYYAHHLRILLKVTRTSGCVKIVGLSCVLHIRVCFVFCCFCLFVTHFGVAAFVCRPLQHSYILKQPIIHFQIHHREKNDAWSLFPTNILYSPSPDPSCIWPSSPEGSLWLVPTVNIGAIPHTCTLPYSSSSYSAYPAAKKTLRKMFLQFFSMFFHTMRLLALIIE